MIAMTVIFAIAGAVFGTIFIAQAMKFGGWPGLFLYFSGLGSVVCSAILLISLIN